MKKFCAILLSLVIVISITACKKTEKKYQEYDEDEQIELEKSGAKEYWSPVLIVLGDGNDIHGITQLGNLVKVENPDNLDIKSGLIVSKMDITVDKEGIRHGTFGLYPYLDDYSRPVYADTNNAPRTFIKTILDNSVNNGTNSAIEDYKINDIVYDEFLGDNINAGAGIIKFTLNIDVRPAKNTAHFGTPGEDGWCRNLNYSFTIWGAAQTWFLKGENPLIATISDKVDNSGQLGKSSIVYSSDDEQYMYGCIGKDDNILTFDFHEYNLAEEAELSDYYTYLYVIDKNNEVKVILEKYKNTTFEMVDVIDNKLYIVSTEWLDGEELYSSVFGYVDTNTHIFHQILHRGKELAIEREVVYLIGQETSNSEQKLIAVDMSTGDLLWSTKLPYSAYGSNPLTLNRIKDGYIHIYYGETQEAYKISTKDGGVELDYGN